MALIKNKVKLIKNAKTLEVQKLRRDILSAFEIGVRALNPYSLIKENLILRGNKLTIADKLNLDLSKFKNIYVLGAGKAGFAMAKGLESVFGNKIKNGHINVLEIPRNERLNYIKPRLASHPYPNEAGVLGAMKILELAKKAEKDDLIFVIISGGGSSLMPLPASGISLEDKIAMNKLLVKSPAKIDEINTVRKHISAIKGGYLARAIYPATAVCLYISDVVGDDLSSIASGPCVPDKTRFAQAIKILKKYNLWQKTPENIRKYFALGVKSKKLETPKPDNEIFKKGRFYHYILGANKVALLATARTLQKCGYKCQILTDKLQGEIHDLAKKFAQTIKKTKGPKIILAGGETTLKLTGTGMGGRNQELVMVMSPKIPKGVVFASFNTDGVDGRSAVPTAGGICDEWTYARAKKLGLKIEKYITNNDSYNYLAQLGETILTGKTGTNVGDIVVIGILS